MPDSDHRYLDTLAKDLRQLVRTGGASLAIEQVRAGILADELSRLLQSSRRLRSQNGKLRRRIERLKAGLPDEGGEEGED